MNEYFEISELNLALENLDSLVFFVQNLNKSNPYFMGFMFKLQKFHLIR
jgi:hypothetical protein